MAVTGITSQIRDIDGFNHNRTYGELPGAGADADYVMLLILHRAETIGVGERRHHRRHESFRLFHQPRHGDDDEAALADAINDGDCRARLDVSVEEPLPADSRFWY